MKPRFIDLFAGIGGTRLAFERAGGRCVFSSEWDRFAQITYKTNHGETPHGDIRQIKSSDVPDHDILVAGFPCQPFSIAGVSKKNSLDRPHGFLDKTQGTLFFEIARIIKAKRPKGFLLENVKNLKSHDKGLTFQIIKDCLSELGYDLWEKIFDARSVVPQHRERIFIVGFQKSLNLSFSFPKIPEHNPTLGEILEKEVNKKYTLSPKLWSYLKAYAKKHMELGNGFGYGLFGPNDVARTLSARYYKDGSEILIRQKGLRPRRLTPRECARLMGFPESFIISVSDTQAYKQFGNSVVVPLVSLIAKKITNCIRVENILNELSVEEIKSDLLVK